MRIRVGNYEFGFSDSVKTAKELTDLFMQSFPLATKGKVEMEAKKLLKSKTNEPNHTDAIVTKDSVSTKSDSKPGKGSVGEKSVSKD